jgi:hypothetical protein
MEYTEELTNNRLTLLNYLLDENEKSINKWCNNRSITINDKWNYMLNYPKEFNKYKNTKIKISIMANNIIELLEKNIDRVIHPGLIILCFDKLLSHISFQNIYNNNGESVYLSINNTNKLKKLRYQIISSFQTKKV